MKNFLFATDCSSPSKEALGYALNLAKEHNAILSLVYIYQGPGQFEYPYNEYTLEDEKRELSNAERKLDDMVKYYYDQDDSYKNIKYSVVKNPSAVNGIVESIEREDAGLVIMSTQGDNLSRQLVFGGITLSLIKKSPIPVLTIPQGIKYTKWDSIAFCTNLYAMDSLGIQELVDFVGPFGSAITLVHVSDSKDENEDKKIEEFWNEVKSKTDYPKLNLRILASDYPLERLNAYLSDYRINILVMTHKEHSGLFYRLFHPNLIKKMEHQGSMPILTFNEIGLGKLKKSDMDMRLDHRV